MHAVIRDCLIDLIAFAAILHFGSIGVVAARFLRKPAHAQLQPDEQPGVSILRPVCGLENFLEATLRSSFLLDYPDYEVLFCIENKDDLALPLVTRLIAEHPSVDARLLLGSSSLSSNPKLNNLTKGWAAARHNWVLMVDSNVLMPPGQIQAMQDVWDDGQTGLVCSPPSGAYAQNVWADVEAAFLNSYQARWQCLADSIGFGFAQGKSMLWNRDLLNATGGIEVLASEPAEDAAATKAVRAMGRRVQLVRIPFVQPLGVRRAKDIWKRQVRWAKLRRETFPVWFVPELLAGGLWPLPGAALLCPLEDAVMLAIAWYAAEVLLGLAAGWQFSFRSVAALVLRDISLPWLWVSAWMGDCFEWRGHEMSVSGKLV